MILVRQSRARIYLVLNSYDRIKYNASGQKGFSPFLPTGVIIYGCWENVNHVVFVKET